MQFGKYRLIRKLAAGGMAEIFLARQEGMEGFRKELVIKRIMPVHADNEELIEMFLDEARIAATLNHPNIVQIFDLGKCDGEYFIAMEYVHGQDLRKIAERGLAVGNFLPLRHAVRIIADAAAGLHYAHNQIDSEGTPMGIVHRDISPQNIIVSFDGVVKILDFGIAKAANKMVTTRHGQLKGKYAYMSPEQCNGLEVDHRSDIFALGTLLYELTVCTRLFKGDTDIQTIKNVSEAQVPPPTQVRPGFPKDLEDILNKALAANPEQRYQSGRQLQQALEDFLTQHRMKTGALQLANYMREILPDKQERPGEDPEFMAEAEAQARVRAEMAARKEEEARRSEKAAARVLPEELPTQIGIQAMLDDDLEMEMEVTPPPAPPPLGVSSLAELQEYNSFADTPLPGQAPDAPPPMSADQVAFAVNPNAPWNQSDEAPPGATLPLPSSVASGEQVSFALNKEVPYAAGAPVAEPEKPRKDKSRKASRSDVQQVEYQLRSTQDPTEQNRGSRIYFYLLAALVLPLMAFAGYQIVKDGNPFASTDSFQEGPKEDPLADLEVPPPPAPLEQVPIKITSTPAGAAVVINGVLQEGEAPGDFMVATNKINTISLYKEGFKPRHKNIRAPASGQAEPLELELLALPVAKGEESAPRTTLEVKSDPEGARILLNGQEVGQTPKTIEVYSGVEQHITLRKAGYQDHVLIKYIFPELENSEPAAPLVSNERKTAERFSEFHVGTRDVEIKIEDQTKGFGPWFSSLERNQALRVELALRDHYPFRRVIQTTVGSFRLSPELRQVKRTPGLITMNIEPGEGLQIYVGSDEYRGEELQKLKLPGGEHTVTLVRESDKKRGELKVMVDSDNPSIYDIDFTGDKPVARRVE